MRKLTAISLAVMTAVGVNALASTTNIKQGTIVFSPFANYTWYASKRHLKNEGGFGASIGYATNKNLLISASVATNKSTQEIAPKKDVRVIQYAVDGNYYFNPIFSVVQPYVGGGLGVWHFEHVLTDAPKTQTNLHANAGLAVFVTKNIGLQGGFQYAYTVTAGGRNDFVGHVGVIFAFGGHDQASKNEKSVNRKAA